MLMLDHMAASGQWLFRWRSFLPIAMLPIGVLSIVTGHPWFEHQDGLIELAWQGFAAFVALSGFVIRFHVIGYASDGTSGRNTHGQIAKQLNTDGMYAVCRNPLYLGNFLIWLSLALMTESAWFVALFMMVFALFYERIIACEEAFLLHQFGDSYRTWAEATPAFFPALQTYRKPVGSFSIRRILRKEYPGLISFALVICLLEVSLEYGEHHTIHFSPMWQWFLLISLSVGFTLRYLRKRTSLLISCSPSR